MIKVAPVEFSGTRPTRLPKAPSAGKLRREVPIHREEREFRRDIASDYGDLARAILAVLKESGAFERAAVDAAAYMDSQESARRREGEKQRRPSPIGRGGIPLSPGHERELRRIFSRGPLGFAADLVEDPVDAFRLTFRSTLDDHYLDLFDLGGRAARLSLGVSGGFNLRSPAIADALDTRANLLSGPIAEDVFDRMLTIIAEEFYLQGEGPLSVARTLEQEFDWLERDRAERIARTETLGVTEEAQWQTYAASGVEWKRWITTLDGRERETHFEAHGQLVPIDEPFEVGVSELMFPGDPDGPPDEICNCRCAHQAVVDESQVFNDRAVWNGENDPDEFSKERVAARQAEEMDESLREFERGGQTEKRARRWFDLGALLATIMFTDGSKKRDYVRDDSRTVSPRQGPVGPTVAMVGGQSGRRWPNSKRLRVSDARLERDSSAAGRSWLPHGRQAHTRTLKRQADAPSAPARPMESPIACIPRESLNDAESHMSKE